MLSKFGKATYSEIRQSIMKLDEEFLNLDTTTTLKQLVPEPEEIEVLKEFSGDVNQLGKPEKFMMEMMKIKALGPRLNAIHTRLGFDKKLEIARDAVLVLMDSVKETRTSKKLPRILELVLAVGNYLNGGTFRGGAYGFKLETLVKLGEVKTVDNKATMYNYLAQLCESKNQYNDLLNILEDFPHVADAVRESIPQLLTDLNKLKGELTQVEGAVKTAPEEPGDPFKDVMGKFFEGASKQLSDVQGMHTQLEKDYKELLEFFGETPSTDSQAFFGNLSSFLENFDKAQKDNVRRKQLAEKQKIQEQKRLEMQERIAAKKAAAGVSGDKEGEEGAKPAGPFGQRPLRPGGNRGMLDNLLADMKTGQAFAPPSQGEMANEALNVFARLKKTTRPLP